MSKIVFFSGVHRSGKSTLVEHVTPMLKNAEPLFMNTAQIIERAGFDMHSNKFIDVIERQRCIFYTTLERYIKLLRDGEQTVYVADRSPLDYLAYTAMLFDIGTVANVRHNERVCADEVFSEMVSVCKDFYERYAPFFRVYVCEPLEYTTAVEGKGKPSKAAQMAIHAMMVGLYSHVTGQSLSGNSMGRMIPSASIHKRAIMTVQHLERDYFLSRRAFVA